MVITGRRSVRSLLDFRHENTPESVFLIWENQAITYKELNDRVDRLAGGLLGLGLGKGDRVMIHLANSPEFIYSFFALLKIGVVTVFSNVNHLLDEISYTLDHSGSSFAITESAYGELLRKAKAQIPTLKGIILADGERDFPGTIPLRPMLETEFPPVEKIPLTAEDDACILYTSGTSGRPKGVVYTHGNLLFAGEAYSKEIRLAPDDRYLCVIPLFHNNALNHQLLPVVTVGASMVLFRKFSASRFGDQLCENQITVATVPSPLLRFILNTPEKPTDAQNSLRVICSGANILTREEFARATRRFGAPITNWFGQTESVVCALHNPLDGRRKEASIGLPILGYEFCIFDDQDREVPPGQMGEIVGRGLGPYAIMKGYYKDPEATAQALKNGWLHTGDLGYMDEDGYFYFVDRKKDMIKVGAENVAAMEVEKVLNGHPKVEESAVIGVQDSLGNEAIKALIILRAGQEATAGELREYCAQRLAKFKVPGFFEFWQEFPRTAAGKIEKKTLKKLAATRS